MLFQNLDLVNFDQKITYDLVSGKKAEEAFQLTEIEMGLKYDRLYSKVATVSWPRFILRSVTFLSSIFALVSFSVMIKSNLYSKNDRIISYVLLSGVVCLESYSIIERLFSDWTRIWLYPKAFHNLHRNHWLSLLLSSSRKRKRWSRLMGQHNLVSALSKKPVNKLRKKLRENAFMLVAIPIFISGMIKYGERIWVFKRNKESNNLSQQPSAKKATCIPLDDRFSITGSSREVRYFHEARLLFNTSKRLFQNLDLVYFDQKFTYDLVSGKKAEEAFQLTEIEMGLKYDRLYSKVATVSWPRFIIRSVTFLSSIFALVSFSIMIKSKSVYSKNDRIISYVLLSGVVCLESYSIIGHLFSDWPMIWLIRLEKTFPDLYTTRCFSLLLSFSRKRKRWSRLMGQQSQHNLVSALSKKPVNKLRKKYFPGTWNFHSREDVDKDLKELIFKQVKDKSRSRYDPDTNDDFPVLLKLLEERGCSVLQSKGCFRELGWSVTRVEFSHSLLTWHIATHSLESSESLDGWPNEKKWEMISEVWVEMLMYAASHSVWKEHVHALARGGELLTHDFINLHLNHSITAKSNHSIILKEWDLFAVDFDALSDAVEVKHHPLYSGGGTEVIGSVNGLVFLRRSETNIAVYNLSTRECKKCYVAESEIPRRDLTAGYVYYGLDYDSYGDDYKVVRLAQFVREDGGGDGGGGGFGCEYEVKVYSLKNDKSKKIESLPIRLRLLSKPFFHILNRRGYGVFAGHALHWIVPQRRELGIRDCVLGFDIRDDKFFELPQPDYENKGLNFQVDVGVLEGNLCVMCNYEHVCVDVWVMKAYGVKESWWA
ncbi:hypothetical protein D5086_014168 [Populus alba]|uniref:Uncharacterized protein n=1 Tax=Populus alba TaxID=43335 RepID=A0ACC4C7Y3_POPAL